MNPGQPVPARYKHLNVFCWLLLCGKSVGCSKTDLTASLKLLDTDNTGCVQMSLVWVSSTPPGTQASVHEHTLTDSFFEESHPLGMVPDDSTTSV